MFNIVLLEANGLGFLGFLFPAFVPFFLFFRVEVR